MRSSHRHLLPALGLAAAALVAPAASSGAQAAAGDGQLSIHGYLTQGYAASHGAQHYGMTSRASSDFRYAALQFRYDKKQDGFLLQVNNRRLGKSPITEFESDVKLNWAFYERRSKDATTSFRLGRIPVPRGIYNEQRSIGVVLPFYRAPVIFYDEGAYFSETIDGAVLRHTFRDGEAWSLETNSYGGGWSLLAYDQSGDEYAVTRVRAENAIGTQLWLSTPVDGLRLGASLQRYNWESVPVDNFVLPERQNVWEAQASLDGSFERFMVRAETMLQHYETDHYYASYAQAGVNVTPKLTLNLQGEYAYERAWSYGTYTRNFPWHKVVGAGVKYALSPSLVLKVENHWNRGIQVEQPVADPFHAPRFTYSIASVSASF